MSVQPTTKYTAQEIWNRVLNKNTNAINTTTTNPNPQIPVLLSTQEVLNKVFDENSNVLNIE